MSWIYGVSLSLIRILFTLKTLLKMINLQLDYFELGNLQIEWIFGWLVLKFLRLNYSRYHFLLIASFKASNKWYFSFYLFSQWKQVCLDFLLSYWIFWNSMIKVVSFLCRAVVMFLKLGDQAANIILGPFHLKIRGVKL